MNAATTQISKPLFQQEGDSYGAGHGFVDNLLIPRVTFKPCIPLLLRQARRNAASRSASSPLKQYASTVASTSKLPIEASNKSDKVKGKCKANAENPFTPKDPDPDLAATESFVKRLEGSSMAKAGIKRDKQEIAQITYEATRGSKYYDRLRERDREHEEDIAAVLQELADKTARRKDLTQEEGEVDRLLSLLEKERDLSQVIVCCDADAFYASVEELNNPSLNGQAFVVGGGIVLTASYEARKYGCRSAMGGNVAKLLCPDIIFVTPKFDKYVAKSRQIMSVLKRYGKMAQASLDEAYLNITDYLKESGMTIDAAMESLRQTMKEETALTVSCGVGCNKLLAKIAADKNKPNGHYIVPPERDIIMDFMQHLPVRKLPGIGRVSESWLDALGIKTCSDIYTFRGKLGLLRGDIRDLLRAYLGIGNNAVISGQKEDRQSCGRGWTFEPTNNYNQFLVELKAMSEQLAQDLADAQISGRTVTLEIKYDTFEVETRASSGNATSSFHDAEELFLVGKRLLDAELHKRQERLKEGKAATGSYGAQMPTLRRMSLRVSSISDDSIEAKSKRAEDTSEMLLAWLQSADRPIDLTGNHQAGEEDLPISDALCPICQTRWRHIAGQALQRHVEKCMDAKEGDFNQPLQPSYGKKSQGSPSKSDLPRKRKTKRQETNAFVAMMTARQ